MKRSSGAFGRGLFAARRSSVGLWVSDRLTTIVLVSRRTALAITPFHLAVQVRDLEESRRFYGELLGCAEGRSDESWADFDLFGHQFVCHVNPNLGPHGRVELHHNPVDSHAVPVPHFGVVLEMADWKELAERLEARGVEFVIEPHTRFAGQPGEQATMFLLDPSGNALEFKGFRDIAGQLFATS